MPAAHDGSSYRRQLPLKPRGFGGLLLCAATAATAAVASAQESAQQAGPPQNLGEVVVTATRSNTTLQEMPLYTTIITRQQIEASPATSVDQLLRQVPGLLVPGSPFYTGDPTGFNITARGLSKNVLVLVDSVPIMDPFYSTIQWFRVPLADIDHIEIVRGGGSTLWGNLAVVGVINIITRHPGSNDGAASFTGGSFGTYDASVTKDQLVNSSLSFNLSANEFQSNGYDTAPSTLLAQYWPGRGDSSSSAQNVRLGTYFQLTDDLSGFLRAGYHVQDEDIGGYAHGANDQKGADFQGGLTETFDAASRLAAAVYGQDVNFTKFNGAGCYAASVYACGAYVGGNGATPAQQAAQVLQYATSYDDNPYSERGGSLIYSHHFPGILTDAEFGADYRGLSAEDSQQDYRTPTYALPGVLRIQRVNYGAGRQDFIGAFAQVKLQPIDRLVLTLSAREDHYASENGAAIQTDYSNLPTPVPGAAMGGPVPGTTTTRFDPSLSARYVSTDQLSFRGSVYEGFRAPGLNNLYRTYGSSSVSIANPLLGPETLVGEEVGLDWHHDSFGVSATVFEENVKDLVATYYIEPGAAIPAAVLAICGAGYAGVPNTDCPGTVSFYTNGQNERSYGVELDATWKITRTLELTPYLTQTNAYYTWTDTGDPTGRQLPLVPKYVAGGKLTWHTLDRWSQLIDVRYNSSMVLGSLTAAPLFSQGGYSVLDFSSTYRFGHGFSMSASVQNLLDKIYTDSSASNPQGISVAMPRAVSVTLRQSF
ncbi:MAG TPA: TonB-dependent receptor [Steroidobacteraceae bacterium]|nr:TonB-dependent receptor [Steroidobacteraceae bacterium]